jgi:hypothetical protein
LHLGTDPTFIRADTATQIPSAFITKQAYQMMKDRALSHGGMAFYLYCRMEADTVVDLVMHCGLAVASIEAHAIIIGPLHGIG